MTVDFVMRRGLSGPHVTLCPFWLKIENTSDWNYRLWQVVLRRLDGALMVRSEPGSDARSNINRLWLASTIIIRKPRMDRSKGLGRVDLVGRRGPSGKQL